MNQLIKWAQGNPGALMFLMGLFENENLQFSIPIVSFLEKAESIRGTNLYVLWSDLCNKDYSQVAKLCKEVPQVLLEEACNRQDYSGRALLHEFFHGSAPMHSSQG